MGTTGGWLIDRILWDYFQFVRRGFSSLNYNTLQCKMIYSCCLILASHTKPASQYEDLNKHINIVRSLGHPLAKSFKPPKRPILSFINHPKARQRDEMFNHSRQDEYVNQTSQPQQGILQYEGCGELFKQANSTPFK